MLGRVDESLLLPLQALEKAKSELDVQAAANMLFAVAAHGHPGVHVADTHTMQTIGQRKPDLCLYPENGMAHASLTVAVVELRKLEGKVAPSHLGQLLSYVLRLAEEGPYTLVRGIAMNRLHIQLVEASKVKFEGAECFRALWVKVYSSVSLFADDGATFHSTALGYIHMWSESSKLCLTIPEVVVKSISFDAVKVLGRGVSGVVVEVKPRESGPVPQAMAVKLPRQHEGVVVDLPKLQKSLEAESKVLKELAKAGVTGVVQAIRFQAGGTAMYLATVPVGAVVNTYFTYAEAMKLIETLAAVHEAGFVHRDIRASNVIRSGDSIVLIDFGAAKKMDDGAQSYKGPYSGSRTTASNKVLQQRVNAAEPNANITFTPQDDVSSAMRMFALLRCPDMRDYAAQLPPDRTPAQVIEMWKRAPTVWEEAFTAVRVASLAKVYEVATTYVGRLFAREPVGASGHGDGAGAGAGAGARAGAGDGSN